MGFNDNGGSFIQGMFAIWFAALGVSLVVGTLIAVFAHGHVLGVLPQNEWSPIIAWVISAVLGYVSIGFTAAAVVFGVFGGLFTS